MHCKQPMIPTFVFGWPTGEETGDFLAVDLGMWLRFEPSFLLFLTGVLYYRWNESACVPGHPSGKWQVRDHAIKIPPYGRTKARRGSKAVRLLRPVPQDVHRHQPWRRHGEGWRKVAVRVHGQFLISFLSDQPLSPPLVRFWVIYHREGWLTI